MRKTCWACREDLSEGQVICLKCNSWQNWQRYMNLSSSTLSLLVALVSVSTVLAGVGIDQYRRVFPVEEVHVSGYFDTVTREMSLNVFNYGDVAANMASNVNCVFGLKDALSYGKTDLGTEVSFWTTDEKISSPGYNLKVAYYPQLRAFDQGSEQVICFSALNYLGARAHREIFFLSIQPEQNSRWWAVEAWFTTADVVEQLYPREIHLGGDFAERR